MMALFLANPPPYRLLAPPPPSSAGARSSQQDGLEAAGTASDADEQPAAEEPSSAAAAANTNGSDGQVPCGGTLVVCPPALLQQWQAELSNHAHNALTVEVYDGLRGLSGALQDQTKEKKRQKPAQREMELYGRLLAGGWEAGGGGVRSWVSGGPQKEWTQTGVVLAVCLLQPMGIPPCHPIAHCRPGEDIAPTFDAEAEVKAALRRLQSADVVLTSFDVLRAEVRVAGTGLMTNADFNAWAAIFIGLETCLCLPVPTPPRRSILCPTRAASGGPRSMQCPTARCCKSAGGASSLTR